MQKEPWKKPPSDLYLGMFELFEMAVQSFGDRLRSPGFGVGTTILGLYLVEILIKDALGDSGKKVELNHNLHELFGLIHEGKCSAVESRYIAILNNEMELSPDVVQSVKSFLEFLGPDPITDARYFWTTTRFHLDEQKKFYFMPFDLHRVIDALAVTLHDYSSNKDIRKRYDTTFISLEEWVEVQRQNEANSPLDIEDAQHP